MSELEDYLTQLSQRGVEPGLDRMRRLMKLLGDPQKQFKTIHVSGTNGKGSVCAMLDCILRSARIRTGLYTSPHLVDIRERITVSGEAVSLNALNRWARYVRKCAGSLEASMTYFEFLTAIALCHFAERRIKIAVLEVGLGGRLDATNIVPPPEVCVVTNIGLEHTQYLGKTISKIAREKAGIIKKGSHCVTGTSGQALKIIKSVCHKLQVPCHVALLKHAREFKDFSSMVVERGLKGKYQLQNVAMVLEVVKILRDQKWIIPDFAVKQGLKKVSWPGRFEIKFFQLEKRSIPILLDGAHNPLAMVALVRAIQNSEFSHKKGMIIFNAFKDKNYPEMIRILRNQLDLNPVWIPALSSTRACEPNEVKKEWKKANVCVFPSAKKMWYDLKRSVKKINPEWILITGSLYLIGEIKMILQKRSKGLIRVSEKL